MLHAADELHTHRLRLEGTILSHHYYSPLYLWRQNPEQLKEKKLKKRIEKEGVNKNLQSNSKCTN